MKKTLLITYYFPPNIGGGEEYLYNIYKRLSKNKIVVLANGKGTEIQFIFDKSQNFKIYRQDFFSGKFKPRWWPLIKFVKKIIKKENIEIIHFGHYANYILLARILKIPYLTFIQGTDLKSYAKSWFGKWLTKSNLKKAQKIITCSHYLKNEVIKLGINQKKIEVLVPSINLEQYNISPEPIIKVNQFQLQYKRIILSVGRIVKDKGFDLVVRVLPEILKKISNAIYIIVGNGPEKENLEKLANKLNIGTKIIFAGEIRDKKELSRYYKTADVYVGPSRAEGFGIVFLEACAFSLPVVATDVGGIKEAVGNKGILVKPDDTEGLAKNIIKILQDRQKYSIDKSFGWDERIEEIKDTLNNLA